MLKQICFYVLSLSFVYFVDAANNTARQNSLMEERYDIMHRNQMDDTDVLAIPLDDSEVEDEEEINLGTHKEVFNIPQAPTKSAK